jgi:hypothetical protein
MRKNIDFIGLLDDLDDAMIEISSEVRGKSYTDLGTIKIILLDLTKRIHANLHAVKIILPEFYEVKTLSLPVSLLIRTCLSDALTGFYLLTFSEDEPSFQNELNVMALDYISYLEKLTKLEPEFTIPKLSPGDFDKIVYSRLDEVAKTYPDLIEKRVGYKLVKKTPAAVRSTSKVELFPEKKLMNLPLTDNAKFDWLFNHEDISAKSLSYSYPLFRFYSQFHHYSVMSRDLLDLKMQEHQIHLTLSFVLLLQAIHAFCIKSGIPDNLLLPIKKNIELIYENTTST